MTTNTTQETTTMTTTTDRPSAHVFATLNYELVRRLAATGMPHTDICAAADVLGIELEVIARAVEHSGAAAVRKLLTYSRAVAGVHSLVEPSDPTHELVRRTELSTLAVAIVMLGADS